MEAKLVYTQPNGTEIWHINGEKFWASPQLQVGPAPDYKRTIGFGRRCSDGSPVQKHRFY